MSAFRRLAPLALAFLLLVPARARSADGDIRIGAVLPVTGKESKIGGAYKAATASCESEGSFLLNHAFLTIRSFGTPSALPSFSS